MRHSLSFKFRSIFVFLLTLLPLQTLAATLQIDSDGNLLGASGVNVDGSLYDVTFVDGSCVEVFSGCDANADFSFTTQTLAIRAAEALLAEVIVDGTAGAFNSNPALINGCDADGDCAMRTPYAASTNLVSSVGLASLPVPQPPGSGETIYAWAVVTQDLDPTFDFGSSRGETYAQWQPSAVPLPGAGLLFGAALFGSWGLRRKNKSVCVKRR